MIKESQVVIEVEDLSAQERRQVLYNHMRLGDQSKKFKADIKTHLAVVAGHPKFSPEIATRLGNSVFTSKIRPNEGDLEKFTSNPLEFTRLEISFLKIVGATKEYPSGPLDAHAKKITLWFISDSLNLNFQSGN